MSGFDWDQSHEWVLLRLTTQAVELAIVFEQCPARAHELLRVRRAFPELRNVPPKALRARVSADGRLQLGSRDLTTAQELCSAATCEGVMFEQVDVSRTGYLPMDRTAGVVWLIEDPSKADRVTQEMLAAGVPVEEMSRVQE
jgi:hypothetical protein